MGSYYHHAVLTHINLSAAREDTVPHTIWVWDKADWPSLKQALHTTDWEALLSGDVEEKTRLLTSPLLALQSQFVPHRLYLTKATDPPLVWFLLLRRRRSQVFNVEEVQAAPNTPEPRLSKAACRRMTVAGG